MQAWAVKPGTLAFNGFSGQMMLNQLVKRTEDPADLASLLVECLTIPGSDEEATAKISALVDYVESIRVGAHPAPGHVPFLLSYFWGLADHDRWPVIWASAAAYVEYSTGDKLPTDPAVRYSKFLETVRELDAGNDEFESTAAWWQEVKPVFLDEVLCDRAAFNLDRDGSSSEQQTKNARVLVRIAAELGNELIDDVAAAVGRELSIGKPGVDWVKDHPRADMWVDWWTKDAPGLGMRVWVNERGAAVALRPMFKRQGWYDEITPIIAAARFEGCEVLGGSQSRIGRDVGFFGRSGEIVYGRWYDRDELADLDLRAAVTEVSAQLQPLFDDLLARALGEAATKHVDDDPLEPLVAQFLSEMNYPTPAHEEDHADRRRFAELLAPDALPLADIAELRRIWNTGRYGNPGQMPALNRSFRDASAAEYDRMIDALLYLCWGDDEDAERIDRMLTDEELRISGLGESVTMKLLAITQPDRSLPVYPYSGPKGKRRMLQRLGLEEPEGTRGQLQVASNAALYSRMEGFFPGDPLGMSEFLYWYLEHEDDADVEGDVDLLAELADELLVDRSFLADIVALLEDKGQIIFYGPPGTGKTYLARKLAEVLAPDPSRRALVQFHPSSSYEDFFEGYRPEADSTGEMTYRLTPGPLALMAEKAADAPGRRHLMIIDEINRANLPKVFGELLFLLEYRGESVRTLYRPEDAFELPKDLWFIGTMNTADRSIALVDAALRRRFHFIPFFPNQGPMKGLLERWIVDKSEPEWVWQLVAQVNDELEIALGGPHLQIGPSHFMKTGLTLDSMRRIWQYNIEPFIEDQFFGDRQQIEFFRFDAAHQRYRDLSGVQELEEMEAAAERAVGEQPTGGVGGTTAAESSIVE
ncbi:MAG: AAA family ATPase [Acidimicrobiales bacterium]